MFTVNVSLVIFMVMFHCLPTAPPILVALYSRVSQTVLCFAPAASFTSEATPSLHHRLVRTERRVLQRWGRQLDVSCGAGRRRDVSWFSPTFTCVQPLSHYCACLNIIVYEGHAVWCAVAARIASNLTGELNALGGYCKDQLLLTGVMCIAWV